MRDLCLNLTKRLPVITLVITLYNAIMSVVNYVV